MLNKIMIALSAALTIGTASAAFANEAPENKIGDRYPFLEQKEMSAPARVASAKAQNTTWSIPKATWSFSMNQFANRNQYVNEAPENKIGDRYPFLEQLVQSTRRVAHAQRHAKRAKHA